MTTCFCGEERYQCSFLCYFLKGTDYPNSTAAPTCPAAPSIPTTSNDQPALIAAYFFDGLLALFLLLLVPFLRRFGRFVYNLGSQATNRAERAILAEIKRHHSRALQRALSAEDTLSEANLTISELDEKNSQLEKKNHDLEEKLAEMEARALTAEKMAADRELV